MSTQTQPLQSLVDKIQSLPPERIAEVVDFVDFLQQRAQVNPISRKSLKFPMISVGKWPENVGLHREDMYGDDGR